MKKKCLKSIFGVVSLAISCIGGLKCLQAYNVGSSLLMDNVEALSSGEPNNGYGFAKEYETGKGKYITRIEGSVNGEFSMYFGKRMTDNQLASLQQAVTEGLIDIGELNDWRLICHSGMGCFNTCSEEDWRPGDKERTTKYGCGNDD